MKEKIAKLLRGDSEMKALGRALQEEEYVKGRLNLEVAIEIQKQFPLAVIGGSLALYLHGIRFKRFNESNKHDLDLIVPYYMELPGEVVCEKSGLSDKDFDYVIEYEGVNIDVKIDPKRRYEKITFEENELLISPLLTIWEAKIRYAMGGNIKHKDDLLDLCGKLEKVVPTPVPMFHSTTYTGS